MEFIETTLDYALEEILRISELSFREPYDETVIRNRLKGKKYWIYVSNDNKK